MTEQCKSADRLNSHKRKTDIGDNGKNQRADHIGGEPRDTSALSSNLSPRNETARQEKKSTRRSVKDPKHQPTEIMNERGRAAKKDATDACSGINSPEDSPRKVKNLLRTSVTFS